MSNYDPDIKYLLVDDVGDSITWPQQMGAVYMRNAGPNNVYLKFDGTPVDSLTDGQLRLQVNEALNLENIVFTAIGFICASGETANLEAIGLIRPI